METTILIWLVSGLKYNLLSHYDFVWFCCLFYALVFWSTTKVFIFFQWLNIFILKNKDFMSNFNLFIFIFQNLECIKSSSVKVMNLQPISISLSDRVLNIAITFFATSFCRLEVLFRFLILNGGHWLCWSKRSIQECTVRHLSLGMSRFVFVLLAIGPQWKFMFGYCCDQSGFLGMSDSTYVEILPRKCGLILSHISSLWNGYCCFFPVYYATLQVAFYLLLTLSLMISYFPTNNWWHRLRQELTMTWHQ